MNETVHETEALSNRVSINNAEERAYTLHRRFDRFARLVGDQAMEKLWNSHVMIMGVGGVGSWAAESLVRSGLGQVSVVDFDDICITNSNRQLHAMTGVIGKKKAAIMAERFQKINPQAKINILEKFYNEANSGELLASKPDLVLDCIDNLTAKCHLIATCRAKGIPMIVAGGASAKEDPLLVKVADLAETHTDPFLLQVRRILRQKHAFPAEGKFGILSVFSDEAPSQPFELTYDKGQGFRCVCPQGERNQHSCEKRPLIYGTSSYVTGAFGLAMASRAIRLLRDA